jgi:hypothetical protein
MKTTSMRTMLLSLAVGVTNLPVVLAQEASRGPGGSTATTLRAAAPVDLTGYWVAVVTEDWRWRMITPPRGDYSSVPLNAAGRTVADAWDPARDETTGEQCRAYGAAGLMRLPVRLRVSWLDDSALRVETDAGMQTRVFRPGPTAAPDTERTWQGHSAAVWQIPTADAAAPAARAAGGAAGAPEANVHGGLLRVMTTNMRPGYLRKNGVPYSDMAQLTEYFYRTTGPDGADWLVVTSIVEDPKYLTEPFITSSHFKKEPDGSKWKQTPCIAPR